MATAPKPAQGRQHGPSIPLLAILAAGFLIALVTLFVAGSGAKSPEPASSYAVLGRGIDDVSLQDSSGQSVTWGALKGTPRAVFFGFTHCPEVCPTTLNDLSSSLTRLGPSAAKLRVEFVTLDPERDTSALRRDYLSSFGPQFRGYAANKTQLALLVKSFRVASERRDTGGGDYVIDHTTIVYLLNANGETVDIAAYQTPPERLDAQLLALLK